MKVLGPGFTPQRIIVPKPEPKPKGRRWDSAKPTKAAPAAAFISLSTPEIPEEGDTAQPGKTHEERTLELTADFNRKLHDVPGDVDRWLAFIRFQDKALFPSGILGLGLVFDLFSRISQPRVAHPYAVELCSALLRVPLKLLHQT